MAMPTCDAPGATVVKNTRSPGASSSGVDWLAQLGTVLALARQRDAVLREHVLREAAAVEAGRVGAAVAVRRAAQRRAPCRSARSRRARSRAAIGG